MRFAGPYLKSEAYGSALFYALAAVGFVVIAAPAAEWAAEMAGIGDLPGVTILALIIGAPLVFFIAASGRQPHILPALLIATGAFGASAFINILPQMSLTFALIGVYGFAGLVPRWRPWWGAGIFAALLIALVLPFGLSAQTGAGFFLRVTATETAAEILNLFGVSFISAHDVLIFENSLARVDAPCSGLKSIFTGSAFFLAASLMLRRRLSPRWLAAYGAFLLLLLTGNIARIVILVTLIEVYDAHPLAELLHIPLGLLFFILACAAGTWFLTLVAPQASFQAQPEKPRAAFSQSAMVTSVVPFLAVALAFIFAPVNSDANTVAPVLSAPAREVYTRLDLTPAEIRFYNTHPQTNAMKWRFETAEYSGSVLMVRSSALTAMHAPEICFEANGFSINKMTTKTAPEDKTYRELSVGDPAMNAFYWMQSRATITDSFTTRLNRYALHGENDWVMVTILFDNGPNFSMKKTTGFLKELEQHVAGLFAGERGIFHD